jgi:hypothetical protein
MNTNQTVVIELCHTVIQRDGRPEFCQAVVHQELRRCENFLVDVGRRSQCP